MFNKKEYQHQWYLENRERLLREYKIKYQENKEEIKKRRKEYRDRLIKENPEKHIKYLEYLKDYRKNNQQRMRYNSQKIESKYRQYKESAKRRDYIFNLSFEEFSNIFNNNCYYCGKENARGIDRIDNKIGYEIINCVSCCEMCNKMKWRYTQKDFIEQCKKIINNLQKYNA